MLEILKTFSISLTWGIWQMNNEIKQDRTFENLANSYNSAKNNAKDFVLEMANICLKAKEQLHKKKWTEWLKDKRIQLKKSQAKKFVAIAKVFTKGGQSTDLLNAKGIEKAYLLTKIDDDVLRNEFASGIIEANFSVKQTRRAVAIMQNNNKSPTQAIEEVKNLPKTSAIKQTAKTVPLEVYDKLKNDYETLMAEKKDLEEKLKKSSKSTTMPASKNDPEVKGQVNLFGEVKTTYEVQ